MRAPAALALTALILLFFLEALRVFFSVLFALIGDIVQAGTGGATGLWVALAVAALLVPALPTLRIMGRRRTLIATAAVAILARVALNIPLAGLRGASAALIVAATGIFLVAAVGHLEQRAIVSGFAAAVLADQLLRFAGWSYDLTLRPGWLPAQIVISLAALSLLVPGTTSGTAAGATELERRSGGLRLRGGLALGALLFLETHVLAAPAVVARWTGVDYAIVAPTLAAAASAALLLLLAQRDPPPRPRSQALALAVLAAGGPLLAWAGLGAAAVAAVALAHAGALLLVGWALAPAGGRRGEWTLVPGFVLLFVLTAVFTATLFPGYTFGFLDGAQAWVLALAGLALLASLVLIPRPPLSPPIAGDGLAAALVVALLGAGGAAVLAGRVVDRPRATAGPEDGVRVATFNVHWGVREDEVFDPAAVAAEIERSGARLLALQEVPAGAPVFYGADLGLWLGRRLGMEARFAPAADRLLGDLFVTDLPVRGFETLRLARRGAGRAPDPRQAARLRVLAADGGLVAYNTRLGARPWERRLQLPALLGFIEPGPAVLLGDLNATEDSEVVAALRGHGFVDAFALAGVPPAPTSPTLRPGERLDWILLRGYHATSAAVSEGRASDHRLVTATLRRTP